MMAGGSDHVLALDVGTSSTRAARFDAQGRRVARSLAQRAYPLHTDRSGKAEINPFDLLEAVTECLAQATPRRPVKALGMSCFWHSLLGVNEAGEPLTPIYTWADSRCAPEAANLRGEFEERDVHAETGCMLRASFWPAKLRWLRSADRSLFRRVAKWISPAEWIQWQLTGRATCARGMATGTGLFDPTTQTWSERMLDACGISADHLLPIADEPGSWGGIPWHPGIGDGAASNLGSGATSPGLAAINIGTSAALRVMREGRTAKAPFGLFCYRVDAKRFLVGGAVSNAGNLHAWCLRELNLPRNLAELEDELAARKAPEHGLTVLPFWNAERAPRWNEEDTGVILGMRQSTSAIDMLQAIMESFYYRLAAIADAIVEARDGVPKWIVSGGGVQNRAALRRLANIFGQPVYANPEREASLRGAAILALEREGMRAGELRLGAAVLPQMEIHEAYLRARGEQARLETLLASA